MTVTEETSGSLTASASEQTLATVTNPGIYIFRTDLGNEAANDLVELRLYAKARAGTDTERLMHGPVVYGPTVPELKISDTLPVISTGHLRATITQPSGTGRAFPWVIIGSGAVPTEKTSGALTATSSEQTLATVTDPGAYASRIDIANMQGGDILEVKVYTKARVGTDTQRLVHGPAVYGPIVPQHLLINTVPVLTAGDYRVTLKQTAGTGRVYPWVIFSTGA